MTSCHHTSLAALNKVFPKSGMNVAKGNIKKTWTTTPGRVCARSRPDRNCRWSDSTSLNWILDESLIRTLLYYCLAEPASLARNCKKKLKKRARNDLLSHPLAHEAISDQTQLFAKWSLIASFWAQDSAQCNTKLWKWQFWKYCSGILKSNFWKDNFVLYTAISESMDELMQLSI